MSITLNANTVCTCNCSVMYCSLGVQTREEWAGRRQRCLKTSWSCVNSGQKRLQLELCNLCNLCNTLPTWTCQTKKRFGAGQCRRFLKQDRKGQLDSMKPMDPMNILYNAQWNTMKMLAPRWFASLRFHQNLGRLHQLLAHHRPSLRALQSHYASFQCIYIGQLNLWQDSFQSALHNAVLSDIFRGVSWHLWIELSVASSLLARSRTWALLFILSRDALRRRRPRELSLPLLQLHEIDPKSMKTDSASFHRTNFWLMTRLGFVFLVIPQCQCDFAGKRHIQAINVQHSEFE